MTIQRLTRPLILLFFSALAMGQAAVDRPVTTSSIWKQKTELSTLGLWGAGHFWALKKDADISRSRSSLGFRFETFGNSYLVGPAFDWQKVRQRGKFNPLMGFQIGSGIWANLEPEMDDVYVAVTPYAGLNTPLGGGVELDVALQLRFNLFFDNFNFLLPSLTFGIKF